MTQQQIDPRVWARVPLFPLPNVVLFPRAVQPLHVFEERYKAMTAHALDRDGRIAMALLRPGWEKSYYSQPAIEPVVCVGRIISYEKLPDGKFNFLLQGEGRARVERELPPYDQPYRVAQLKPLAEQPASEEVLAEARARLRRLFQERGPGHGRARRQFRELLQGDISTPLIVDLLAFTYLDDIPLKQALLAEEDVLARVETAVAALEAIPSPAAAEDLRALADPSMN